MSKRPLIPGAEGKLEKFKMEVAKDMSVENNMKKHENMGDVPSSMVNKIKNSGNVGGEMVKRMVEAAEKDMVKHKNR